MTVAKAKPLSEFPYLDSELNMLTIGTMHTVASLGVLREGFLLRFIQVCNISSENLSC